MDGGGEDGHGGCHRLSGLNSGPLQFHLIGVDPRCWIAPDQAVDAFSVHEVGADEAGEGDRTFGGLIHLRPPAAIPAVSHGFPTRRTVLLRFPVQEYEQNQHRAVMPEI